MSKIKSVDSGVKESDDSRGPHVENIENKQKKKREKHARKALHGHSGKGQHD